MSTTRITPALTPDASLISATDLIEKHKWTPHFVKKLMPVPVRIEQFKSWKTGYHVTRHLYQFSKAMELQPAMETLRDKALVRRQSAKENRPSAISKTSKGFAKKYPNWKDALPLACDYLFNLNRYTKHEGCTATLRDKIYELKNALVKVLYLNGYSSDCHLHQLTLCEKLCFGCDGTGFDYDEECGRCDGTGIYLPAKVVRFVAFRFLVGDKSFCWHQPEKYVKFKFTTTKELSAFVPSQEYKPIDLAPSKFLRARQLLAWVILQAGGVEAI